MERTDDTFSPESIRGYQLTIVTQLLQAIDAMHHADDIFQWLASVIVQRFDVPIIQVWTCESSQSGQPSARLRATARQDPSLPAQVVANEKVAMTVAHLPREQRIFPLLAVEQLLPYYQASLLKRYGLRYCAYWLINRNVRFASAEYALAQERPVSGLTFIALLFLQRPPRQDPMPTISTILEQAVAIAENHGLLLPITTSSDRSLAPQSRQSAGHVSPPPQRTTSPGRLPALQETPPQELALTDLIPRRKQDARLLVSDNPFASSATISDKQAFRLYAAIDGHKTIAELCRSTGMSLKEVLPALQALLALHRVELYTPDSRLVDTALLFKNR